MRKPDICLYLPPGRFARSDLVDAAVTPAAVSAAEALAEGTAADIERTAKYLERYRDVRAKRAAMQVALRLQTRTLRCPTHYTETCMDQLMHTRSCMPMMYPMMYPDDGPLGTSNAI